jgi:CHAT domain-containing protein/Tfp pilus assembly protein PilF
MPLLISTLAARFHDLGSRFHWKLGVLVVVGTMMLQNGIRCDAKPAIYLTYWHQTLNDQSIDTAAIKRRLQLGSQLSNQAQYDSSVSVYRTMRSELKTLIESRLPGNKRQVKAMRLWLKNHYLEACLGLGWNLMQMRQRKEAETTILDAIEESKQFLGPDNSPIIGLYNVLATIYQSQGFYDKAFQSYTQFIPIQIKKSGKENGMTAVFYNNLGTVYQSLGDFDQAIAYKQRAHELWVQEHGPNYANLKLYLAGMAINHMAKGQYDQALDWLFKADEELRKREGVQHPSRAFNWTTIGAAYSFLGDNESALNYYHQSNALLYQIQKNHEYDKAIAYNLSNIAILYTADSNVGLKKSVLQQALKLIADQDQSDSRDLIPIHINLSGLYLKPHSIDSARYHYYRCRDLAVRQLKKNDPYLGHAWHGMAQYYNYTQQLDSAHFAIEQSLRAFLPHYQGDNQYPDNVFSSHEVLETALVEKLALHLKLGTTNDKATLLFADQLIDSLRRAYTNELDKLQLAHRANTIYGLGIDLVRARQPWPKGQWHASNDAEKPGNAYVCNGIGAEAAFEYAEKNKASILAQAINESKALQYGDVPDSLVSRDRQLRIEVGFLQRSYLSKSLECPDCDTAEMADIQRRRIALQMEHQQLKKHLEQAFPRYYALKYAHQITTVKALQESILAQDTNTAILAYAVFDTVIHGFCITQKGYTISRLRLQPTRFTNANHLQLEIRQIARAVSDRNLVLDPLERIIEPAEKLYQMLIAPFEKMIQGKDLIIIPDGELFRLPFEVLIKSTTNWPKPTQLKQPANSQPFLKDSWKSQLSEVLPPEAWASLPYLLKSHRISYHYSATLLLDQWRKTQTPKAWKADFIGYAPVFDQSIPQPETLRYYMAPLPATATEVRQISQLFQQNGLQSTYHLHQAATKSAVNSRQLAEYRYVHLATHGLTDEDRPERSCIILATDSLGTSNQAPASTPSPANQWEQASLLTGPEMYDLSLSAELVVLSACQTGRGKLRVGEGLIGLTRGLLYAGAQNLLVSQWNVNDVAAAELMVDFYQRLLAGNRMNQALHSAKLKLINSPFACPFYWAPFVLIGH